MSPIYKTRKSKIWIAFFLAPTVLIFVAIVIIPLFQSFYYSFFEWNGISTVAFRGLENYKRLLKAREMAVSMKNSVLYSLELTAYQVGLGTLFAFIFSSEDPRKNAFSEYLLYSGPAVGVGRVAALDMDLSRGLRPYQ